MRPTILTAISRRAFLARSTVLLGAAANGAPVFGQVAEEKFDLVVKGGQREAWLGATDEKKEGEWVWLDGSPMTFKNWQQSQPNNKGGVEHYLGMWTIPKGFSSPSGNVWVDQPDVSTQHKPGFICEWNQAPAMPPTKLQK